MADEESTKRPKRRLRTAAPTVREQAEKAQASSEKPKRGRRVKAATKTAGKPLSKVWSFLGHIFNRQPFRLIGKILRFIGRIIFPRYLRNSFRELRFVSWPNRKQSRQLTFAVLAFAIIFGASIALLDYGLDKLFKSLLLK